MIIKINRISRSGKLWESFCYLPDTYSFRAAVRHLKKAKNVKVNRKVTFEQVFDLTAVTKPVRHYDHKNNTYRSAIRK